MPTTLQNLLSRALPSANGCLIIGKPTARRYWTVGFRGRTENAHKVAWILSNGEVPKGLEVCHKCDNTRCINPDHLFLGTHQANMSDRDRKGRNGTLGEKSPLAKLTAPKVVEIFNLSQSEKPEAIAIRYSVSPLTVKRIQHRQTWKHILSSLPASERYISDASEAPLIERSTVPDLRQVKEDLKRIDMIGGMGRETHERLRWCISELEKVAP